MTSRPRSDLDLDALRRIAEAADPNAWGRTDKVFEEANARFIVKASPTTVLALLDRIKELEAERDGIRLRAEEVGTDEGWWIGGAWGDYGEAVVPLRILSYVIDGALDQKVESIDPGFALTYAEQVARADRAEARLARVTDDSMVERLAELRADVAAALAEAERLREALVTTDLDRMSEIKRLREAIAGSPEKAKRLASLVASATRLVQIERDDARAALARVTDDSMAERIAQAIHDGPEAQKQYVGGGIEPHEWGACRWQAQYRADAKQALAVVRAVAADEQEEPRTAHDWDRMLICRRCGIGLNAGDLIDGERPCVPRTTDGRETP